MQPSRIAILGATWPVYELYCPNFTGMTSALSSMGIEHKIFNIRPTINVLDIDALREFNPDVIVYGLIDMVKARSVRLKIRRALPNAKIVMWYGDLRNQTTGQIREDMSEIDAMFVSNAAQNEFYERMWRVPECHYLPLGSMIYDAPVKEKWKFDCVFIGAVITGKGFFERRDNIRMLMSDKLIKRIDGPAWKPDLRAKVMKEMPSIYRSAKISLDWSHFTDIKGYTSNRFWIITASGGFALTHWFPGCEELYPEGTRVYFKGLKDFKEKRAYYLKHEDEREKIRLAGYAHAQLHTYESRFARMFEILYGKESPKRTMRHRAISTASTRPAKHVGKITDESESSKSCSPKGRMIAIERLIKNSKKIMHNIQAQDQLVVGLGEVGRAIQNILGCDGIDTDTASTRKFKVLHICFPYSDSFVEAVKHYVKEYEAPMVIVHSSVPMGTCDAEGWIHSPVRGVHPNLEQGIKTFVKYFGGKGSIEAGYIFAQLGINVKTCEKAATTEALKLWDTTQYGLMILIQKEIHEYCEKHGLDFDLVYTDANHTYDIGYEALSRPEVCRPYLKHVEGPIGGHCVIPNAKLLESPLAEYLVEVNDTLK